MTEQPAPAPVAPKPANVPHNAWRQVALPSAQAFTASLPVSVVMPCHGTPAAVLERTLAALEGQRYPRHLMEVVIVDDGSAPPLSRPRSPLNVRMLRQGRRGHGIARARNAGARAAAHDIILFLDGDSLPEAGWMAAHARWHHCVADVVTLGFRAHVGVDGLGAEAIRRRGGTLWELLAGRPADPPGHENNQHMLRTNELTAHADDLFRAVLGGNFGVGKPFYWSVGGSDESFARWGFDEAEFAWRAQVQGALFVPVREALVWHQGRMAEGRVAKRRSARLQRGKLAQLIAHPAFRGAGAGRVYAVPAVVVTIDAGAVAAEQVIAATASVLADRCFDLVVRVELTGGQDDGRFQRLREAFAAEPRVRLAPARMGLDEFPASPLHVALPAGVSGRNLVHRLERALGDAAQAVATLPDGGQVSIARSWALHRARRGGSAPAAFGAVRRLRPERLGLHAAGGRCAHALAQEALGIPGRWRHLRQRAADVHSLREAWWFVLWLGQWAWRRVRPSVWTVPREAPRIHAPPPRRQDSEGQGSPDGGARW